jgi:hypothetical protein
MQLIPAHEGKAREAAPTICDDSSGGLPTPGSRSNLFIRFMDNDGPFSRPSSTGSSKVVLFTPRTEAAQAPAAASVLALAKLATSLLETDVSSSPGRKVIVDAQLGFVRDAGHHQAAGCIEWEGIGGYIGGQDQVQLTPGDSTHIGFSVIQSSNALMVVVVSCTSLRGTMILNSPLHGCFV